MWLYIYRFYLVVLLAASIGASIGAPPPPPPVPRLIRKGRMKQEKFENSLLDELACGSEFILARVNVVLEC